MTKAQKADREEAIARLREMLKPGQRVHTILRSVAASGMSRHLSVVVPCEDGDIRDITGDVWRAVGYSRHRERHWLKVTGCGFDAGYDVAYNLGWGLFGEGYGCIGEGCQSNDHTNGDRDFTPHGHRGPRYDGTPESLKHWHTDGGYAFRHSWL